ncbi:venom serine protease 34-like [Melanaphis sacchari]|uniref:Venom serine protease 34 n=1 Tax=Melanaphis sacchari TaxID=742174 RepID=A0A2H8TIR4_9HEMI|nr:venom serine protease 34-like [Melanaphis sacchari]
MMHRGMTFGGGQSSSSSFLLTQLSTIGAWLMLWWCCAVTTTCATELEDYYDYGYYRFDGSACEFYQIIEPGNSSYYLYSPGFPDPYPTSEQDRECRWFAKTPSPTDRLVLSCYAFDLPESQLCESDALIVSRTGNANFTDGIRYCGSNSYTIISLTNSMYVKFVAKRHTIGGRFSCLMGVSLAEFRSSEIVTNSNFCECGVQHQGKFTNRGTAGVSEYPLLASLIDGETAKMFCSATVIDRHHALTAAHCLININLFRITLLVGDHDMTSLARGIDSNLLVVVSEIYIHPLFDPSSVAHDLAIVETEEEIPFSSKVGPACFPFKHIHTDFVGDIVKVFGWGTVSFNKHVVSGTLHKSYLKVVPTSQCAEIYKNETDRNSLCTHFTKVNSCQVDSGSPLLWTDPSTGRLNVIGVVSNRFICDESMPSMHTRLATVNNMNWIKVILMGQYYCS